MENTQSPSQTATTPPPSSNVSTATPNVAPERSAAVSHALQQAVPPKPAGGVRTLSQQQTQNQNQESRSNQDREISLEDFDDEGNLKPQTETVKQTRESKPHDGQKTEDDNTATEKSSRRVQDDKEGRKVLLEDDKQSDEKVEDKLELDINLDEELKNLPKDKQGRDYSKFKPEHAEYLKHLPNRLFEKFSEELLNIYNTEKENKELKEKVANSTLGKLPESYYEHESAYTLTPRYKELEGEVRYDSYEENHWQEQLMRIKQGQDWVMLKGYSKEGVPQFERVQGLKDAEDKPIVDVRAEMTISQYLDQARNLKRQHLQEQQSLQQNHQKEYLVSKQGIENLKQTFFKPLLDESKLSPVIKGDINRAKEAFAQTAPAFKNSPVSELLSLAYATMKLQQRQMLNMMKLLNGRKAEENDAIQAGPSKEEFRGGSNQGGDKILSEKDFE